MQSEETGIRCVQTVEFEVCRRQITHPNFMYVYGTRLAILNLETAQVFVQIMKSFFKMWEE